MWSMTSSQFRSQRILQQVVEVPHFQEIQHVFNVPVMPLVEAVIVVIGCEAVRQIAEVVG